MKRERTIKPALSRMVVTLLLSKLVALRRRMTSSMRGCVHCPVCRWGVRGVCVTSLRSGSGEDVPAAVREVEVAVDVVASAVDDMLFFDVCCMCLVVSISV